MFAFNVSLWLFSLGRAQLRVCTCSLAQTLNLNPDVLAGEAVDQNSLVPDPYTPEPKTPKRPATPQPTTPQKECYNTFVGHSSRSHNSLHPKIFKLYSPIVKALF